jgi:hypothetical protein
MNQVWSGLFGRSRDGFGPASCSSETATVFGGTSTTRAPSQTTTLRRTSPGAPPDAQLGAVSFFHRFGSSLNVHPHCHLVVLDGVFGEAGGGESEFHEASEISRLPCNYVSQMSALHT